jgi:hypothetical protein
MRPMETIPGIGIGRIREDDREAEFNYDLL